MPWPADRFCDMTIMAKQRFRSWSREEQNGTSDNARLKLSPRVLPKRCRALAAWVLR